MTVNLIVSWSKLNKFSTLLVFAGWSQDVLELCKEFRGEGVVGIDLADQEIPAANEDIAAYEVPKYSIEEQ